MKLSNVGQAAVEMILILTLFLSVTTLVAEYFRSNEVFAQLVSGPWENLSGMIQNGVWMPPRKGAALHPSQHRRHYSVRGERDL